jgi:hypothetical protein
MTAHVLFYRPAGFAQDWEKTDLWHRAARIPGVRVLCDEDGLEARHFGAATSGHVLLYRADGRLLFSGGITTARGHAGASAASESIVSFLTTGTAELASAPVFGCPLYDPSPLAGEGSQPCCPEGSPRRAGP